MVLAVFLPIVRHEFICYDDNGYVTANAWVQNGLTWANVGRAFSTTEIAYWHPLTWISHLVDVELFGLKPWGHHLTSALLHAVNALLVFVVLHKMTGAVWRSWFVAALFGLHPLHVESVAWVAERKDVLSTFFWLLAIWSYARWTSQRAAHRPRVFACYGLSLLCFAAGLMSKPMVVTLPCVLLLLDYWPLNRWGRNAAGASAASPAQLFVEKIPFFALSGAASIVTVWAQASLGTIQTIARNPWTTRVANALVSYAGYLGKCFYPAKLAVFYPYPAQLAVWPAVFAGTLLTGLTVAAVVLRKKKPYLLAGWLFFVGTLVPVIGLVQVGDQAMADRYSYVPLLGVFIIVVWSVADVTRGWARRSLLLGPTMAAVLAALAALTNRQLGYWRDSPTLFHHALAVTENNWCAHFCLGYYFALFPSHESEAIAEYRAAVGLAPRFAEAHFSLGTVLARTPGSLPEAVAEYRAALRLNPRYVEAHAALGKALVQLPGRLADAATEFGAAARLAPDNFDVWNDLADTLAQLPERLADAVAAYRSVLRLRPDWVEIHSNLGLVLAQIPGRLPEAIAEYETVLRTKPGFAEAHNNLANALVQVPGRSSEAIAEYETALRLRPDYYEARFNLGTFLSTLPGRRRDAIVQFETALRIKPDFEPARVMLERLRASSP